MTEAMPGGQIAPGEVAADQAEGDVEQEDPAPVAEVQDDAAEHRADDRAERGGHGDQGHDLADVATLGRLHDQRGHQHHQNAAADALDDPEGDQARSVPRGGAQQRADEEQAQGGDPQSLAAQNRLGPADRGHRGGQGQQVGGGHPLDGAERGVQLPGKAVDGDAHDRGVEDDGERADDQREDHASQGRIGAVGSVGVRGGGWWGGVGVHGRLLEI
jgi:hypothetical protein